MNEKIDHYWVTKPPALGTDHLNFPFVMSMNWFMLLYNTSILRCSTGNKSFFILKYLYIYIYIYPLFHKKNFFSQFLFPSTLIATWNEYHDLMP